jgi:RHS repeat-associated protein
MAVVVEHIEALAEGLLTVGTEVALLAARHLAMFMNLAVTTEATFYRSDLGIERPLILSAHRILTYYPIVDTTNGNRTSTYAYDKVGNRQAKTVNGVTTVYTYDANDRLLNEKVGGVVTVAYTYDDNGSTLSKTENGVVTTYVWNDEKRLVQATVGGTVVDYRYNDAGIRVSSKQGGVETRYLLDEGITANVWEEYGPDGTVQGSYSYGYDLITQTQAGQTSYYLVDGLGSTRLLTDAQGLVLNSYGYEAFGETVSQTGTTGNRYQYAGEQLDGTLGDYYLRQRFYDTNSGRFGRMDEYEGNIDTPLSIHKYLYTHDNPIMGTDPSGFLTMSDATAAMLIQNALTSMAFSIPLRTLEAAQNVREGADLGSEILKAAGGVAFDTAVGTLVGAAAGAIGAKVLQSSSALVNLRMTGQSIAGFIARRTPSSVWNMAATARGRVLENYILGRAANIPVKNFPVIDDFANGVATSIKSMDLTAPTYQSSSRIISQLNNYAGKLSQFTGRTWGGITIPTPQQRVLYVAFEYGSANRQQAIALRQFLQEAAQRYPNVRIVFNFTR